jgi:hypothetical protein
MKKGVGVGGLFLGAMGNNTLGGFFLSSNVGSPKVLADRRPRCEWQV